MIKADVHTHTAHSHAADSCRAMAEAARNKGLDFYGFSEHSPRPPAYFYPAGYVYQEKITRGFPIYLREVAALRDEFAVSGPSILLGMELDFMPAELDFAKRLCNLHPFDYIVGGLHFQGHWGFDYQAADWEGMSIDDRFAAYAAYYEDLYSLCDSGLADIAAHPDLIKIFSIDSFRRWVAMDSSLALVRKALTRMKEQGMSMEISSAGFRKPCAEIYPGPRIMALASELKLPVTLSSDAHATAFIGHAFPELEAYARSFGYQESVIFVKRAMRALPFA